MSEKTFAAFTPQQSAAYSQFRSNYHPSFYASLLHHHTSTGGQLSTLLDAGCGPGTVTFSLAKHFTQAIGIDASPGMISTANSLLAASAPTPAAEARTLRFAVATAESLGSDLPAGQEVKDASIDLLTVATAAHWFDMPSFWRAAARVVKPSGSVALWTGNRFRVHPSVPNGERIQAVLDRLSDEELSPFYERGTLLARGLYRDLVMPWAIGEADGGRVEGFEEGKVWKKTWTPGDEEVGIELFEQQERTVRLEVMEKMLGTGSPVVRWREANPEKVGTEEDIVRRIRRAVEGLLREAGVKAGEEALRGSVSGVLIVLKRS